MPNGLVSARLTDTHRDVYRGERVRMVLLGVLAASGALVFIEPAPYDVLAIVMLLGLLVTGLRFPTEIRAYVLLLAVFIAANAVAAAVSADPVFTLRSLSIRIYLPLTWLLVVCLIVTDPRRMLSALWIGYLVAAVFSVVWGALEYWGFIRVEWFEGVGSFKDWAVGQGMRAHGAFKDPNVYGPFLIPATIYAASRVTYGKHFQRLLFVGLLLLFLFGILLSYSRGAWINCAVALVLFLFLAYRNARSVKRRMAGLIVATVGVAAFVAMLGGVLSFSTIGDRFYERAVFEQDYDMKSGGRFDTQKKALIQIGTHPLGVGPAMSREQFGIEPHNMYLQLLNEAGWIGGLAFIGFVGLTLVGLARATRAASSLQDQAVIVFSALCGLLAQTPFIDATHWRHMWLVFAMSAALTIAIRRERRSER